MLPATNKIEFVAASEVIEMNEAPLLAVRRKKDSSMAVGARLLKEGKIDALVSTGNTGALIATALFHLSRLPNVDRPALLALLPTAVRGVAVLDVGANLYPKPHHLIDFARIGLAYRKAAHNIEDGKVGLLNIGVEEEKGTAQLKEGYTLLQEEFGDAFLGNVEGREVYEGKVDVLVTDGFTGNVFLKTSEGVSSFLVDYLKKHFGSKAGEEVAHELHTQFNYAQYPGALLAGLDGVGDQVSWPL